MACRGNYNMCTAITTCVQQLHHVHTSNVVDFVALQHNLLSLNSPEFLSYLGYLGPPRALAACHKHLPKQGTAAREHPVHSKHTPSPPPSKNFLDKIRFKRRKLEPRSSYSLSYLTPNSPVTCQGGVTAPAQSQVWEAPTAIQRQP